MASSHKNAVFWMFPNFGCLVCGSQLVFLPGVRFTNIKTLLSKSLTCSFPMENYDSKDNCDSRAWWISTQDSISKSIKMYLFYKTKNKYLKYWKLFTESSKLCTLNTKYLPTRQTYEIRLFQRRHYMLS